MAELVLGPRAFSKDTLIREQGSQPAGLQATPGAIRASKLPGPACSLASTYSHFLPGVVGRAGPEHPCLLPPQWDLWKGKLGESGVIS